MVKSKTYLAIPAEGYQHLQQKRNVYTSSGVEFGLTPWTVWSSRGFINHNNIEQIDSGNGKGRFNWCEHEHVRFVSNGISISPISEWSGYGYYGWFSQQIRTMHTFGLSCWLWDNLTTGPGIGFQLWEQHLPCSVETSALLRDATKSSTPRLEPEVSIINFMLELKDFKTMFNFWDTRHSVTKNLSNGFLNWNFGWKPFVGELKGIFNAGVKASNFLSYVRAHAGKPIKSQGTAAHSDSTEWTRAAGGSECTLWYKKTTTTTYSVTRTIVFRVYDILRSQNEFDANLQAMGVLLDPSIVWNAIPFSFVADWFFPISNWLENFSIDIYKPMYDDVIEGASAKSTTVTECGVSWDGGLTIDTVGSCTYTSYHRDPNLNGLSISDAGHDTLNPLAQFTLLSAKQASLGVSLLYSNSKLD